ncbi:MAG: Transcriptional regulator, AraC family [Nevskia sp.]|nr:Transcriptional regulator, AraC family [Nevskia sp.]
MDSLSHLVRMLAPSGSVDLRCRFAGDWFVAHDPAPPGQVPYHVILEGRGRARIGRDSLELEAGDVLLFPRGAAHILRSVGGDDDGEDPAYNSLAARHFNGVLTEVTLRGEGQPLDMLCGTFAVGGSGGALLRTLPEVLLIRTAQRADCAWLAALIGMMRHESEASHPGGAAIIGELSTALFTVLLRALMAERGASHGLLALLGDARLSRAVEAVLREPAQPWTIASMAAVCNLSRATFARQFAQLSGLTPLELVTSLRMELAARLLAQENLSAERVSEQCGYASQAAFGRVFKQHYGVGPGAYRRQARDARSEPARAAVEG